MYIPIHTIGNSLKKQKRHDKSITPIVLKPPYKVHKLMGILWAHTGTIACIVIYYNIIVHYRLANFQINFGECVCRLLSKGDVKIVHSHEIISPANCRRAETVVGWPCS